MAGTRPLAHLINTSNSNRSSTSLITPALSSIADPQTNHVDANLFDLLTSEVSLHLKAGPSLIWSE